MGHKSILYIYDSVRTCERENHFEAIDSPPYERRRKARMSCSTLPPRLRTDAGRGGEAGPAP